MSLTEDFSATARRQPPLEVERRLDADEAFRRTVGEDFLSTGRQELALLRALGLSDGHYVVDVGCGAGRLSYHLAPFPRVRYLGCDIAPELLRLAGELTDAPQMRFVPTDGATIEAGGARADFVCFFSVFEHLHYEHIFKYFLAAAAKLKPGGLLVMSFFEFRVEAHWDSFVAGVESPSGHLNQFIDRDAIAAWAAHAGFDLQRVTPGGAGRSLAILQKRRKHDTADDLPHEALAGTANGAPAAFPLRMANTSNRVFAGPGAQAFIQGLVLQGEGTRSFLLRAVGPSLKKFNLAQPMPAPELALHDARGTVVASGRGWNPLLAKIFTSAGAFELPEGSGDAAFVVTLAAGSYTISVSGETAGTVLVEVYELPG